MKVEICKIDGELMMVLPDEAVARLGWRPGDILETNVQDGDLRLTRIQTKHDRAMQFARRSFRHYADAYKALARSEREEGR